MVNKKYCMSSFLAFRYIADDDADFCEGMHHENVKPVPEEMRVKVRTAGEIDRAISESFSRLGNERLGICLSGGMDSAILATYMRGCDAYTFRFLGGSYQGEELGRAEWYARLCGLKLHYVDIDWGTVEECVDLLMGRKGAPVHSIEPQIYKAAMQARADGVEKMVIGESSDLVFGGMDQLLSRDWDFDDFVDRYVFVRPEEVLREPCDMRGLFERYRVGDKIDFLSFMDDVFSIESSGSYYNAFGAAGMPYADPYAGLSMSEPLDLGRVRAGESKYLVRELFAMKYPGIPVPEKVPMPRPVDFYFRDWKGPSRPEFKENLDMARYTGNQKWLMWCLERFLDMADGAARAGDSDLGGGNSPR